MDPRGVGMRISAQDIHNKKFRQARMRGYNADDVDEFLDELATALEADEAEVSKLKMQVQEMSEKVTSYSGMEGTLNSAIISAQKLAEEITAKAEAEAKQFTNRARLEADEVVAQAKTESAQERADSAAQQRELVASIERLQTAESDFRDGFRSILKEYEALIEQKHVQHPGGLIASESALIPEVTPTVVESAPHAVVQSEPTVEDTVSLPDIQPEPEIAPEPVQAEEAHVEHQPVEPTAAEQPIEETVVVSSPEYQQPEEPIVYQEADSSAEEPHAHEAPVEPEPVGGQEQVYAAYEEASEEQVVETVPEVEPIEADPSASGAHPKKGLHISDEDRSSREIAEAVERMKKMLGESEASEEAAPEQSPAGEDEQNLFEPPAGGQDEPSGFGDLGEGVPGVRKRRRPDASNPESEVD